MQAKAPEALCDLLEWDSEFFGIRIATCKRDRLDTESARRLIDWCVAKGVSCLYLLADPSDPATARVAADFRFCLVDVRVTFSLDLAHTPPQHIAGDLPVRLAAAGDISKLRDVARLSHRATRFYFDGNFPRDRCDELYATWIEKSCKGFADAVFVAGDANGVDAYITGRISPDATGSIGLLAVREAARGRGYGRALMATALDFFRARNVRTVSVATQGRNIASQRLYEACGFRVYAHQLWYHRWFLEKNDPSAA